MAPSRRSIKVVEICRVAPPANRPDSAAPKSLPLTFLDIVWLRFPPVQRLFFYETEATTSFFYDSIVPKLKNSLSLALHHYLPLAGNLIWPENSTKPIINYLDGDGVSFTVAESDGLDFQRLTADGIFCEAEECHPLIPKLFSSHERAEVIALQVTLLPRSGFCVGITAHHAVLDGKTSTSFMKSWARICRSIAELADESSLLSVISDTDQPFYDRTVVKDPAGLAAIYANAWLNEDRGPENRSVKSWEFNLRQGSVRGTFELTRENIERLRKSVTEKNPAITQLVHVSTFSLTCSYTLICLATALEVAREGDQKPTTFLVFINADLRTRLKPAVPAAYFGNCVGGIAQLVEMEALLEEDAVSRVLEAIGKAVKSFQDNDVLKGAENWVSMILQERAKLSADSDGRDDTRNSATAFAGSPRFEVYSTDFGFGRPKKVEMTSIDRTGAICLSDSKNGNGGIEIGLLLKQKEMEAFASEFVKGLEKL